MNAHDISKTAAKTAASLATAVAHGAQHASAAAGRAVEHANADIAAQRAQEAYEATLPPPPKAVLPHEGAVAHVVHQVGDALTAAATEVVHQAERAGPHISKAVALAGTTLADAVDRGAERTAAAATRAAAHAEAKSQAEHLAAQQAKAHDQPKP